MKLRPTLSIAAGLVAALGACLPPVSVHAQTTARSIAADIPPGPLEAALTQYARAAGLLLSIDPGLVAGKHSPGLRGTLPPDRALAALLQGTGLEAVRAADGGYTLRRLPASGIAQLSAIEVTAAAPGDATEDTRAYTTDSLSFGGGASLSALPQSVSVMTHQRLREQNLDTLEAVMSQTPGVTRTQGTTFDSSYYSRGMQITNLQIDGGAPMTLGLANHAMLQDFAQYDRVEVLRGADALFGGSGEAGGTINLVRKRPTSTFAASVEASAGSWDHYRVAADIGGPIAYDGKIRARLVAAHTDRHFFYDVVQQRNTTLYGILEADLGPRTVLALGGTVSRMQGTPWFMGLPRYLDGSDLGLPRSTSLTTRWSHHAHDTDEGFLRLDHQFNDDWSVHLSATHNRQTKDYTYARANGGIDPVTQQGQVSWFRTYFEPEQTVADAHLQGAFEMFGRRHEVRVGAAWQNTKGNFANASGAMQTYTLGAFDPDGYWDPTSLVTQNAAWGQRQSGIYGSLRLQLTDPMALTLGARVSRYRFEQLDASGSGTTYEENGIFTPFAGLSYDLSPAWTAYGSIAETYKSQANRLAGPLPGNSLDPVTGRNYEVGLKGSHAGGRYASAIALYRIERSGEAVLDPDYPSNTTDASGGTCCYLPLGDVVSQGVDLELTGELLPGWQFIAGYTYNSNQNKEADSVRYSTVTPRHLLKLWTMVQLPRAASAWRVGGGVNVQSAIYVSGTARTYQPATGQYDGPSIPFSFSQGGYAVWGARVEYRVDRNWTAALNVDNIFDKRYYQTVGPVGYWNWYGEPRSFMLSLRGTF
ncbi:TonB-dependent siderophore receptor [Verticiella sediminum]|uniref:TonB-dependent siderophore receptor n=1 Tax=Verticiella sediminum TaxID=1247510 RepID=A0A556AEC1_9BURK|nr:TonB-dependent siderophore receptor [Verticiella sediminum]TSH91242.1 TonB-dependent siderophore receptor [Verticiella sediminum]